MSRDDDRTTEYREETGKWTRLSYWGHEYLLYQVLVSVEPKTNRAFVRLSSGIAIEF
jgi:hypothetical protein